eukprot:7756252-Pyramimonas_sp.AAC.1
MRIAGWCLDMPAQVRGGIPATAIGNYRIRVQTVQGDDQRDHPKPESRQPGKPHSALQFSINPALLVAARVNTEVVTIPNSIGLRMKKSAAFGRGGGNIVLQLKDM